MAALECLQSRTEVEAEELGERHGEIGVAVRLGECRSSLHQETRLDRMIYAPCQLRLVLASGGCDHREQAAFVNDEQAVVVEPAPRKPQQAFAVIRAGELIAQGSNERAAVMVGEPLKPERVAGDLLVLDQCWCPAVHRAQRREVRCRDTKALTEMPL